jgi:ACS family pantothenate transporter-like MFS transporter
MGAGERAVVGVQPLDIEVNYAGQETAKKSRWARIQEIVWDGERSAEERKLVQRLDIFIL